MLKTAMTALMIAGVALATGCSVYKASTGEKKRDLDILAVGTPRDVILAEFGTPVASERGTPRPKVEARAATDPGGTAAPVSGTTGPAVAMATPARYDIFRFVQGRSTGSNAGRAVIYGAAAVFTLGLSEVLTTPLESAVGDQGVIRLRVTYDADDRLTAAHVFDQNNWVPIPEFEKRVAEREEAAQDDEPSPGR